METKPRQQWLSRAAWRGRIVQGLIVFGVITVLLQGIMVVDATTFATDSNASSRAREAFADDAGVVVTSKGIGKIGSTGAAVGDTSPGMEATSSLPQINNVLIGNHYAYVIEVKESAGDSWRVGEGFKIEVYGGGGDSTALLATLYIQQAVADHAAVDGVTVRVDVGSSSWIPDFFDVVVTRQ